MEIKDIMGKLIGDSKRRDEEFKKTIVVVCHKCKKKGPGVITSDNLYCG
jgi:hypothetical protein